MRKTVETNITVYEKEVVVVDGKKTATRECQYFYMMQEIMNKKVKEQK